MCRVRALCVLAALVMTPLVAPAPASAVTTGDWTQFRNGAAHLGVSTAETVLSPSTVGGLRRRWVTTVAGSVFSSTALAGVGRRLRGHLLYPLLNSGMLLQDVPYVASPPLDVEFGEVRQVSPWTDTAGGSAWR